MRVSLSFLASTDWPCQEQKHDVEMKETKAHHLQALSPNKNHSSPQFTFKTESNSVSSLFTTTLKNCSAYARPIMYSCSLAWRLYKFPVQFIESDDRKCILSEKLYAQAHTCECGTFLGSSQVCFHLGYVRIYSLFWQHCEGSRGVSVRQIMSRVLEYGSTNSASAALHDETTALFRV